MPFCPLVYHQSPLNSMRRARFALPPSCLQNVSCLTRVPLESGESHNLLCVCVGGISAPLLSPKLLDRLVGWLWTKNHILLGPRCYFTSDPPLVELSPCSKDGQGEGEAAVIAHKPVSQGIEPGTTESVDREESPEPPAPQITGPSSKIQTPLDNPARELRNHGVKFDLQESLTCRRH